MAEQRDHSARNLQFQADDEQQKNDGDNRPINDQQGQENHAKAGQSHQRDRLRAGGVHVRDDGRGAGDIDLEPGRGEASCTIFLTAATDSSPAAAPALPFRFT